MWKQSRLLFNPHRRVFSLSFLLLPLSYALLVRGLRCYWLENDLRHLYKEILKPYYRRLDDKICADHRELKAELEGNRIDPKKSMVVKLRANVEQKVHAAKYHSEEKEEEKHIGQTV
jgi:hypothetical protein